MGKATTFFGGQMNLVEEWTSKQKRIAIACFLGWCLDAFDFFLLVFVLKDIAAAFDTSIAMITYAIFFTLAMRPIGAFIFGRLADKYGRKPVLMANIGLYSFFSLLTAFSPNLTLFLIIRCLFGIAMGGEWGVGSALVMESLPKKSRGFMSGVLQAGYPAGYLLASLVFGYLYLYVGWRGMFIVGILPSFLVLYIRSQVNESPIWHSVAAKPKKGLMATLGQNWKLSIYAIVLMTAFNSFSHGSQDLYPTFLRIQQNFDVNTVKWITVTYNIGAILGGILFGILSEHIGRRYAIIIAALIALPIIPFWAFGTTPLVLGISAFLMQMAVQGAWGVIPVYLNELSPASIRGTFPGTVYQLGNLFASYNATLQAMWAANLGGSYSIPMAAMIAVVALVIAGLVSLGYESKGANLENEAII
jgi:MFS transporter, SHS family, lactate transporter